MSSIKDSLIAEDFLRKLETLTILTKKGAAGPLRGIHRALRRGEGLEFLDYRKYHPGDDLRYVDWNIYGRLQKLFIKLFLAEENLTVNVLLDLSQSMTTGNPTKALCAQKITAALGYVFLANFDKLSVTPFTDKLNPNTAFFQGKKNYPRLLAYLLSLKPGGPTNFNVSLTEFAQRTRKRGIIIILSDCMDASGYSDGLKILVSRNHTVSLIQILEPEEIAPLAQGNILLQEIETGVKKKIFITPALIQQYKYRFNQYCSQIRTFCLQSGIDFFSYHTQTAFEQIFIEYITTSKLFK